ncbi:MAG TPA: DUF2911 domain-containing protein [Blastocatellia bacterium]|nr:DUF2911 domain-containing protein [Blastocatellia bacterium]
MKFHKLILCLFVLCAVLPACAQMNGARETSEVTIKGKTISVNYGSPSINGPSLKGKDIFTVAPVGMVWRLGKNQATELTTTGDLNVAGKTLPAGKYSLWAKKTGDNAWVLAFHPKTGIWGEPAMKEGYVAELPLKSEKVADSAEMLNISLVDMKGKAGIRVHWGTALLVGTFDVK